MGYIRPLAGSFTVTQQNDDDGESNRRVNGRRVRKGNCVKEGSTYSEGLLEADVNDCPSLLLRSFPEEEEEEEEGERNGNRESEEKRERESEEEEK